MTKKIPGAKRGRPRSAVHVSTPQRSIRISDADLIRMKAAAAKAGMNLSEFVRRKALDGVK